MSPCLWAGHSVVGDNRDGCRPQPLGRGYFTTQVVSRAGGGGGKGETSRNIGFRLPSPASGPTIWRFRGTDRNGPAGLPSIERGLDWDGCAAKSRCVVLHRLWTTLWIGGAHRWTPCGLRSDVSGWPGRHGVETSVRRRCLFNGPSHRGPLNKLASGDSAEEQRKGDRRWESGLSGHPSRPEGQPPPTRFRPRSRCGAAPAGNGP